MSLYRPTIARVLIAFVLVGGTPASGHAQTAPRDLARVSIEDLLKIEITSAAKKEQRAEDVPAAVFVITQEDIRRSGLQTLPDLFRLVPGMQVAQVNSSMWAISARGFNDLFSNKLLVLIDGRSIYNHEFGGVFWDGEDLLLENIDRIEVIRGAGGTVWGANAMNGVINIVTKSAAETAGTSLTAAGGAFDRRRAALRHGGSIGPLAYRFSSQWSSRGDTRDAAGAPANDRWTSLATEARADWTHRQDAVMAQASFSAIESHPQWQHMVASPAEVPTTAGASEVRGRMALGRWMHTRSDGSLFQVQAFATTRVRDESILRGTEGIADVEVQYRTLLGSRHDLVLGSGYRADGFASSPTFNTDIANSHAHVFNTFLQDEIAVAPRVKVTLGSKVEHDNLAGWGALPSARVMWNVTRETQRAWAAVSQARRTPSAAERGVRVYLGALPNAGGIPLLYGVIGNPKFLPEQLTEIEGGYRVQIGAKTAVDVTAFRGGYDRLSTLEPTTPSFETSPQPFLFAPVQYSNLLNATSAGMEIAAHWAPVEWWRLDGSYSGFHVSARVDHASQDAAAAAFDGHAPQHQWQVHSSLWATPRLELDASVYHVGPLTQVGADAYSRADARVEFKISNRLSAVATGQNLFDPAHMEFPATLPVITTAVPRSANLSLSWKF